MRINFTFIHQRYWRHYWYCQPRLRMRVIGPLVLLVAAAMLASSGKARIWRGQAAAMPSLRGEAATGYLKQQGLYSSLREAVKAARYGVYPSSPREDDPTSTEIKKLTASDGVELDFFGRSVATNGNMAIVGAPQDDIGSNSNQGSVYIFERNQGGPNNWGEVKKLTASDGANGDGFGESVAIHGDMAIVGATGDAIGDNPQGSAYIFERNQGGPNNWGEVKKLTASDDVFSLGGSVAIHGDTAIVAALGFEFFRGSVYVFSARVPGCCK